MLPISTKNPSSSHPQPPAARGDIWHALVQQASHLTVAQIDAFVARLANALLAASEHVSDAKEANLSYNAGQLLKNNAYSFYYLAAAAIAVNFRQEIELLQSKENWVATQY